MKKHTIKNSCGKKGCFINVRVLPYGNRHRRERTVNRNLKMVNIPLVKDGETQ